MANDIIHVTKGSIREALCVPLQQLARTVKYKGNELTISERNTIFELINSDNVATYNPEFADLVKNGFQDKTFKEEPLKYLKLWAKLGIKYPKIYIDAFFANNLGFWYPDTSSTSVYRYIETEVRNINERIGLSRKSILPNIERAYDKIVVDMVYQKIPVVSMLFNGGFYFWVIILTIWSILYYRKYLFIYPILFLICLWITLLLSPIVIVRYSYPLFVCFPIILAIIFNNLYPFNFEE